MPLPLQLLSLVTVVVVIAVVTGAVASAAVIVHTQNILTATADTPLSWLLYASPRVLSP